jgi:L-fuconolactonase
VLVIDAQVHIWAAHTAERPWQPDRIGNAQRDVPLGADELLGEMAAAGVDRVVLVPPSWEGYRNDLSLAAARAHPGVFAVMGRLDLGAPGCRAEVEAFPDSGLAGYRLVFGRPADRARLHDGTADAFWEQAERLDIPVMVYAPGSLPEIGAIARRHPGLRLTVDHLGLGEFDTAADLDASLGALLDLAGHGNIAVKASALPCAATDGYPYRSVHPAIHRTVAAFGADRVFWGTDFSRLPCGYPDAVRMFTEELGGLTGDELESIMGRGIARWLRWDA